MRCVPSTVLRLPRESYRTSLGRSALRRNLRTSSVMCARSYDDAVDALNSLQTNFKILEERRKAGITADQHNVMEMRAWLQRIGYSNHDLDRLNIVHVAGTKGKGTTCAFVSSILAHHQKAYSIPRKTGLFTSPHLVSVRERIRINESPISEPLFCKYFFEVWDLLESSAKTLSLDVSHKPAYFRYLTLMSFHAFLRENVNVAIYEVGVGGEFDSTNIVDRPAVTGISTLGIDHVSALGDTIEKISWHKAGILKPGTPAFTVKQVPEAAAVIARRAQDKGVTVQTLAINPALRNVKIKPAADFQRTNASLAIALASTVLQKIDPSFELPADENQLPQDFVDGLEQVLWRGRCETKIEGNIRWYLDGAHTADSLKVAAKWFAGETARLPGTKVLIFNQQGRTEAPELLRGMFEALRKQGTVTFDNAVFCTNVTHRETGYKRDFVNHTYDNEAIAKLTVQKVLADCWKGMDGEAEVAVEASIEEALDHARSLGAGEIESGKEVQVLITGSLHLIGGALAVLEGGDAV